MDSVLAVFKTFERRLREDPREFGDVYMYYADAKLTVYIKIIVPIVMHYAVHDEEPTVIVQAVMVLSGWGLEEKT